ncbi:MAG: histidine ammonia-lyase [Bacteroidota bacterium]
MVMSYEISLQGIAIDHIPSILGQQISLSEAAKLAVVKCRTYLDEKMQRHEAPIYGINTGFGALYNKSIPDADLEQLQENLVKSHACGMGEEVPAAIVKIMLLLKVQGLSFGHSGVELSTVQQLVDFYNLDILPVIYQQGSLGASGDLAPLAHLALALSGGGEVQYQGKRMPAKEALAAAGLQPIRLRSKEGLALLNGTQFMSAYGVWCLIEAGKLSAFADRIGALSLEGYDGRIEPFYEGLHTIRPHAGQLATAKAIAGYLDGSEIITRAKEHVQDPYSFRCMPQVHGASKDAIAYVKSVFQTEINSVTDNPTIFPDEDLVLSGGNFHGQPLAISLDFLAIALAELGSISERRVYQLISGRRGLPPFLVADAGLNSGFMIPQYTAASIASQNKQLCSPASVDSIESSNGQEDHVSMGANAATKCFRVVQNVERILAIELMNASQAIEFRRPLKTSAVLEQFLSDYRKRVPYVDQDRFLHVDLINSVEFLRTVTAA